MPHSRIVFVLVCLGLLVGVESVFTQRPLASTDAQRGVEINPFATPDDVEAGRTNFESRCAACHGADGRGNRGPDLTREVYRHGNTDRAIFMNILSGIPGTGMPSVRLSDKEMWQLVAYVRSLSRPEALVTTGDPAVGRVLYSQNNCGRCHFVDGDGGRLGPDLSTVGWSRSAAHLRGSIVDPDDDIEDDYRQISVTDSAGVRIEGVLRNEDTYSVLLLETTGRLRAFLKADIRTIARPAVSLMPSFADRFDEEELNDLVAYLSSLRRR